MGAAVDEEKAMTDGTSEAGVARQGRRALPDDPAPWFEAHVFVCCNRRPDGHRRGSCAAKGSEALRDYMKARAKELGLKGVRVNMAGCLDRCECGPTVVVYPEGVWYKIETNADVDEVLAAHLVAGGRVPRLMLTERHVPPPKEAGKERVRECAREGAREGVGEKGAG
jgi:(2Fe-2S) ferredoxin